ncbi:MAG: hypothetical protein NUV52_03680 [Candidatus Roizmanbacteria bacterium]|nr:hypothetical protein [Candidatus Roizmanbacteria bacterium]
MISSSEFIQHPLTKRWLRDEHRRTDRYDSESHEAKPLHTLDYTPLADILHDPTNGKRFGMLELLKTGSKLYFFPPESQFEGIVRHSSVREESAFLWESMMQPLTPFIARIVGNRNPSLIPAAPILLKKPEDPHSSFRIYPAQSNRDAMQDDARYTIYSRYCGLPLSTYRHNQADARFVPLMHELESQRRNIEADMQSLSLAHGHAHDANYTVEFVQQAYLEAMGKQGYTLNTLPYDEKHISVVPDEWFAQQEHAPQPAQRWRPILRLIDFDGLSISQTALLTQLNMVKQAKLITLEDIDAFLKRTPANYYEKEIVAVLQ